MQEVARNSSYTNRHKLHKLILIELNLVMLLLSNQVVFKKPVSLTEHPKVNEWLTCVESEMRTTLATLLATAVTDVQQFNSESIDGQEYMKWVDSYQVRIYLPVL